MRRWFSIENRTHKMMIDAFSQTDWRRFVYYARTKHRKELSPAHSCKLKGLLILFAKGPLKAHHVPTTPWQMISMNCNTSNWIIALIYSIFAMFGRTAFELAFQSVGMLSVIWSSELQTSWSMVFQFLQTWCCVADSKAKAFARAIGVHNILIHSNKKLTMQGLKVNAFSSVSVIGREHF